MTLYEAAGGYGRLLAMTEAFYGKALADDLIGEMFSEAATDHARHLAGWLSASFGGPPGYLEERGDLRFVVWKHAGLRITEPQRARWADLMMDAAAEVGMPPAFLGPYGRFVETVTRSVRVNSNTEVEIMRAELGLAPGEDLAPRHGDGGS
ncbi:MAG: globin [Pseudomonadota bacterium]